MVTIAEGLPTLHDGAALFLPVARGWAVADAQPSVGDARTRGRRPGGEPVGRRDRPPVGQDDRSGRAAGLRCGQQNQGPDTSGLLVAAVVHAADIQDRDGAPMLLGAIRSAFPWLHYAFADSAYAAKKLETALARLGG